MQACRDSVPPLLPLSAWVDAVDRTAVFLRHCSIRAPQARALAACLEINQCLMVVDLGDNDIGDSGATALAQALQSNTTITSLDLSSNGIGGDAACCFTVNGTPLRELSFANNALGDDFGATVGDWVRFSTSLCTLNVSRTGMKGKGGSRLAAGLALNTTLTQVRLLCTSGGPPAHTRNACVCVLAC
jgi:Ran GTPase-activating protein (RanGAP) involved in mRNA processing and transport